MNLHQFRFVQEAVRRNLNLTEAAKSLHTSQPGRVQGHHRARGGTGHRDIHPPRQAPQTRHRTGPAGAESIDLIMREIGNLKRIGNEYSAQDSGTLSIATTHTQARYVLPPSVSRLRLAYPKVNISLHQGAPDQVAQMVMEETADIGIATESLAAYPGLVTLPCYEWQHMLVSAGRPCPVRRERVTLEDLAERAADHLPPVVHRPHPHRPGVRHPQPGAAHRARGHRLRRDHDLRAPGHGRGHRGRNGGARHARQAGARTTWWSAPPATCSARTSPASPSSAAPTCATSCSPSPNCSATASTATSSPAP